MATRTETENAIQEIYIGLLGRAADKAGLEYWADEVEAGTITLEEVRTNIVNDQPEYEEVFGGLSRSQTVNQLYNNLFGRDAEPEGLTYWVSGGGKDVPVDLLVFALSDGALGNDRLALDNKVTVAQYFTENATDSENKDDAALVIADVDHTTASVNAAKAKVDADYYSAGETQALTAGQDSFTGTSGDDRFVANEDTLQSSDILDGGAGTDTLEIRAGDAFFAAPELISIENIVVKGSSVANGNLVLDLSDADDVELLKTEETSGAGSVQFRDIQSSDVTLEIIDTRRVDHHYTFDLDAYLDGTTIDLSLEEVGNRGTDTGPVVSIGNTGAFRGWGNSDFTEINITSSTRDTNIQNYLEDLRVGSELRTVNISGNADLEVERRLDRNITNVDAGELVANLWLDLYGQGGNPVDGVVELTVTGAQGNDNIDIRGDGHNLVNLGEGNDDLTIRGDGIQDITLGNGNDRLFIRGRVDDLNTVPLWDGVSTIDAGAGDDNITIVGRFGLAGDYDITLGDGNDELDIYGDGDQTIDAGEGNDTVHVHGDGDQSIEAGAGNDSVLIEGNGIHYVDLAEGDDFLHIEGGRQADGQVDNGPEFNQTVIIGGEGNDVVVVDSEYSTQRVPTAIGTDNYDHYLDVDLGAGDDSIQVRAKDLTIDDIIDGGEGSDTLVLTNAGGSKANGSVGLSETGSVVGIETFALRDSGITLVLGSDNFDTAEEGKITVNTELSIGTALPPLTVKETGEKVFPIVQGMTYEDYLVLLEDWHNGVYAESHGAALNLDNSANLAFQTLQHFLLTEAGVEGIDFADRTGDEDSHVVTAPGTSNDPTQDYHHGPGTGGVARHDDNDQVYFRVERPIEQVVDITNVPLTAASGRSFELEGGNIKDVIIADDDSINGRAILRFDDAGANNSVEDTLIVQGAADITAADLRNVSGLENIVLQSPSNTAVEWNIVLSAAVINQTTGSADLTIKVSPEVAAGSKLYITLDPTVNKDLTNNLRIETVSNVQVYINGDLVTEPDFGVTDYNGTGVDNPYSVMVFSALNFTTNTDSLVGTDGPDTFVADSLAQIQNGDSADGNDDPAGEWIDTLLLNFNVSNPGATLEDVFSGASLVDIEHLEFNTGNNVHFNGIGAGYWTDLEQVTTGSGNDHITSARKGLTYVMGEGNDTVELLGGAGPNTVINGGNGDDDLVVGSGSADIITTIDVETINGGGGSDAINISRTTSGNVSVNGGTGTDTVNITAAIVGTVSTSAVEFINGSSGNDTVVAIGATNVDVDAGAGNDHITVGSGTVGTTTVTNAEVHGEDGNDTLIVTVSNDASVTGGAGNDSITVNAGDDATVEGGSGNDTIVVTAADEASVDGGAGNDSITVNVGTTATVLGGTGNDTLNVNTASGELATIIGGEGNDSINLLVSATGGQDRVVFGDIVYDALQAQTSNTQGTDTINGFNLEAGGAGAEDVLDFTTFLPGTKGVTDYNGILAGVGTDFAFRYGDWTGGNITDIDMDPVQITGVNDAVIAVIAADNGFVLNASHITTVNNAPGIEIDNDGRAVVLIAKDTNGDFNFDQFDVYFVQDVDQDTGAAWKVDLVATINSATEIGALTSVNADNFVW